MNTRRRMRPQTIRPRPPILAPETCPLRAGHTEGPANYLQWHAWAEKMERTHRQCMCEGCGRYLIWERRT